MLEKITPPKLISKTYRKFATLKSKRKTNFGIFICSCGEKFEAQSYDIERGHTKSCGCFQRASRQTATKTHGLKNHRLYGTWLQMLERCENKENKGYKHYGARGIKVCDRWKTIKNFIDDMYPSFKEGLTLDRINTNENYDPNNCRWASKCVQSRNTRLLRKTNSSGYRGVTFEKRTSKWYARIRVNYKRKHLGTFTYPYTAAMAYDSYVIKHKLEHTRNYNG